MEESYNYENINKSKIFDNEQNALDFIINADLLKDGFYCSDDCSGILKIVKKRTTNTDMH